MDKITITVATPATAAHWLDWVPDIDFDTLSSNAATLLPILLVIWWSINILIKVYGWFKPDKK